MASSTLATGIALSLVFGSIFGGDWRGNFPFVLGGVVAWSLVGGMVTDGAGTYIGASGTMQAHKLPLTFHNFLQLDRTLINFVHQVVAFWLVTAVLRLGTVPHWQLILGVGAVLIVGFLLSIPLGMLSARFRDISYMVSFLMAALFMLTPVFWRRSQMRGNMHWIVDLNPLSHLLEVVRQPLLGHPAALHDWIAVGFTAVAAAILALFGLVKFRRRVVFWL
jgi:ABC-type polysaccharide/polyol phosphate export permease